MKPVIVAVDEAGVAEALHRDLNGRYGSDYEVIVDRSPAEALRRLTHLQTEKREVAVVIAGLRLPDRSGVDFLQRAGDLHPEAKRLLLLAFGDVAGLGDVVRAMALGQVDSYTMKPWASPEGWLHPAIGELLSEWVRDHGPRLELFRIVGTESSGLYLLRDVLDRNLVPYGFVPAASPEGERLLREHGLDPSRLPVVIPQKGPVLVQPSLADLIASLGAQTQAPGGTYDLVVVGAGPAGLAAAVNGASEGLRTVLLESEAVGGQASKSSLIRNYVGFPRGIRGSDLAVRAFQQTLLLGASSVLSNQAVGLRVAGESRTILCADGSAIEARSVIIATGMTYRRLGIPEVDGLVGVGVFYGDAASEAPALKGRNVFISGGGNSAADAAVQLAKYADRVTLLVRGESLGPNVSAYLQQEIQNAPEIEVRPNVEVTGAQGVRRLEGLTLRNIVDGSTQTVPADALFVLIGSTPHTDWLGDTLTRDAWGYITTGYDLLHDGAQPEGWTLQRPPYQLETSIPGVFAAGDVRGGSMKRIASAVGEGAAAISLVRQYLKG